jgi:hypothetical protein
MSFSTFSGPLRAGTQRYNPGRNTGLAVLGQSAAVTSADAAASVACILPAGSQIVSITLQQSTTFTSGSSGTFTVLLGGTQIGQLTVTTGTAGNLSITPASGAQAALFSNVGSTDATITYTSATLNAGAGSLLITYIQRAPDGSQNPTTFEN